MTIFQSIADWIKGLKTPVWLKALLQQIQDVIVSTLLQIGKEYLVGLQSKIFEVNAMDISPEEKFQIVFKWGKSNIPNIKDAMLNLAIELLYNKLKNSNFMRTVI